MLKDLFNRLEFLQFNPDRYLQDLINYSFQQDLNILILLAFSNYFVMEIFKRSYKYILMS